MDGLCFFLAPLPSAESDFSLFISCKLTSITDADEFLPDGIELDDVKFELLRFDCKDVFGVGGNGELACRFSGFGEPKLPTEL